MAKNGKSNGSPRRSDVSFETNSYSIPEYLLPPLDEYCLKHDRKKSEAVTLALKMLFASELARDPAFWMERYQPED